MKSEDLGDDQIKNGLNTMRVHVCPECEPGAQKIHRVSPTPAEASLVSKPSTLILLPTAETELAHTTNWTDKRKEGLSPIWSPSFLRAAARSRQAPTSSINLKIGRRWLPLPIVHD